jgi:hypothetical protein
LAIVRVMTAIKAIDVYGYYMLVLCSFDREIERQKNEVRCRGSRRSGGDGIRTRNSREGSSSQSCRVCQFRHAPVSGSKERGRTSSLLRAVAAPLGSHSRQSGSPTLPAAVTATVPLAGRVLTPHSPFCAHALAQRKIIAQVQAFNNHPGGVITPPPGLYKSYG